MTEATKQRRSSFLDGISNAYTRRRKTVVTLTGNIQDLFRVSESVEFRPLEQVIYQTLDGLHSACPNHTGDWYFSGNYPTPGGNKVVNRAFINYMEGKDERAY